MTMTTTPTTEVPFEQIRAAFARGYQSQRQELAYWIDEVEGTIPPDLHGTFFRNGPGLLDVNGQRLHHPIDGDGMVFSMAFANGRAFVRNRFVRTKGFLEEQEAGKILYRSPFGTQKPGGMLANIFDLRLKNLANTSVTYWGGTLWALWEGGEPHRLDPYTLETLGLDDLGGILSPGKEFAAHYRIDPDVAGEPHLVNFGSQMKLGIGFQEDATIITIYEFDQAGKVLKRHAYQIPGFSVLHDMAITPNHCIFFQTPLDYNAIPYVLGIQSIVQSFRLNPSRPTRIVVLPRDPEGPVNIYDTKSGFIFHLANAFEDGNTLCVDAVSYADFPQIEPGENFLDLDYRRFPAGELWRYTIDTNTGTVERRFLYPGTCDFPTLHPQNQGRPYRYVYLVAAPPDKTRWVVQTITKLDLATGTTDVWNAAPYGFPSEALFVPRPDGMAEDDGWLLSLVYDGEQHRSSVVILDARDLAQGPIARLQMKHHLPHGFHGCFVPDYFGPEA